MSPDQPDSFSFGAPSRYYAADALQKLDALRGAKGSRSAAIEALLKEFDPDLENRVARSFRQWNNALRELLRTEMGLRLSVDDEAQAAPVRVAPGLPMPFEHAVAQVPPELWRFILRLPALEAAMVEALDSKRIRGAALDVFEVEPAPKESPLWGMDNVLMSCHTADHTKDWLDDAINFFLAQFARWKAGKPLKNVVDK